MNTKNAQRIHLKKKLAENAIPAEEVFRNFTPEQNRISQTEIRYYDMLVTLRNLRKKLGLTQEELAKKADIPRTTITKIESGTHNPTISTLMSIASAMNKRLEVQFL